MQSIIRNRRLSYDFFLLEELECGIVLTGLDVKEFRHGRVTITNAFAKFVNGELFLHNLCSQVNATSTLQTPKKLLLHKRELNRLVPKLSDRGCSLVPSSAYFKNGKLKVSLCLVKGKKSYDKRESLKEMESRREARSVS